jgi:hypothetical protein
MSSFILTRKIINRLLGALFLSVVSIAPAQANLLTNGGFETGDLTGWTQVLNSAFATVYSSSPPYYPTASGNWQLGLDTATKQNGGSQIYQDIATAIGDTYEISFALRPHGGSAVFGVGLGGPSIGIWYDYDSVFSTYSLAPVKAYQQLSRTFTAVDSTTRVTFGWLNAWDLDNTAVTKVGSAAPAPSPVPEPSVMLMLVSGLVSMVAVGARRRKS